MQTANQQNNSSLTPLSDPGSASSSSTQIQQNCVNENNNNFVIGNQQPYPPQFQHLLDRWAAANMLARTTPTSNPSLAAVVANMQLTVGKLKIVLLIFCSKLKF